MTSINGFLPARGLVAQQSLPKLVVGEAIQVRVLGPTRSGLSVLIAGQPFQLDVPSRLSEARTLTLQGVPPSSSESRVQIVALDDRPLSNPIPAKLTSRSQATPPAESAIIRRSSLQVIAHPVDANGKTLGQGVTLNLQAERPVAAAAQAGSLQTPTLATRQEGPDATIRQGAETSQRAQLSSAASDLPLDEDARGRGSAPDPNVSTISRAGSSRENASPPFLPPVSVKPADVQTIAIDRTAGDMRGKGDPSQLRLGGTASIPSVEGGAASSKNAGVSAVSMYRRGVPYGSQTPSTIPSQPLQPSQLEPSADRAQPDTSRTIKATVIARTDVGQIVLKAANQLLRVEQPIDLPIGTTLQANLVPRAAAPPNSLAPGLSDSQASPLAKLITLLDSIDQAGRHADLPDVPDLGKQLPAPDKYLASRLLDLLAAGTDRQAQPGQRPVPDQGAPAPKEQIQALVRDLAGAASEPNTDGWKSLTLPIGHDQAQAVCCYFRHHELDADEQNSDGDNDRKGDAERAVFDVSLSRLGRCQIDALCQEQRFDLLIRTEERLSETDRQDIAALFLSASEVAGMIGDISFRIGGFFEPAKLSAAKRDFRT